MPAVREARHRIQDRYATLTTAAALAARKAIDSIPIVTVTGEPVESGLAASYAHAGGNVTGLTHTPSDEWLGKLLALKSSNDSLRARRGSDALYYGRETADLQVPNRPMRPAAGSGG